MLQNGDLIVLRIFIIANQPPNVQSVHTMKGFVLALHSLYANIVILYPVDVGLQCYI